MSEVRKTHIRDRLPRDTTSFPFPFAPAEAVAVPAPPPLARPLLSRVIAADAAAVVGFAVVLWVGCPAAAAAEGALLSGLASSRVVASDRMGGKTGPPPPNAPTPPSPASPLPVSCATPDCALARIPAISAKLVPPVPLTIGVRSPLLAPEPEPVAVLMPVSATPAIGSPCTPLMPPEPPADVASAAVLEPDPPLVK